MKDIAGTDITYEEGCAGSFLRRGLRCYARFVTGLMKQVQDHARMSCQLPVGFKSGGFVPDAQRTCANTGDLRNVSPLEVAACRFVLAWIQRDYGRDRRGAGP